MHDDAHESDAIYRHEKAIVNEPIMVQYSPTGRGSREWRLAEIG